MDGGQVVGQLASFLLTVLTIDLYIFPSRCLLPSAVLTNKGISKSGNQKKSANSWAPHLESSRFGPSCESTEATLIIPWTGEGSRPCLLVN